MISRSNTLVFSLCCIVSLAVFFTVLLYHPAPEPSLPVQISMVPAGEITPEPITFHDVSLKWRIKVSHQQTTGHLSTLTETLGSGICAIDVNKDGWMDLFFVGGSGHTRPYGKQSWWYRAQGNRLLLNKNGHHFEDITGRSGLEVPVWGMACAVADFDNNGLPDLVITGVGKNLIFENNGDLSFTDVTEKSGILNDGWSMGASLADFDGDGLIDIYISNYILFAKGARTFEQNSGFRNTMDSAFNHALYDPEPNRLYRNKGNFRFDEIGESMGVTNSLGRSLGAKWVDINLDSWPDLLVINDHNTPNQLFISQDGKSFLRADSQYKSFETIGGHDMVIDNFDNEVQQNFFVSRGMGYAPVFLAAADNNLVHSHTDVAWARGIAQTRLLSFSGWGATAADFNNDGFLDLYVANGSTLPDIDSRFTPQAQSNTLFVNNRHGSFLTQATGFNSTYAHSSRGVISIDLDNDGRLELVVSNNNDVLQVFENQSPVENWIGLDLHASLQDAEIYGASLTLRTETRTIRRTLQANQNFLSQGDARVHIGLGGATKVTELVINWRDGRQSLFKDMDVNQYYTIDRAANTFAAQHYQVVSESHLDASLSAYSDKVLIQLAELLITTSQGERNSEDIMLIWYQASNSVRRGMLELIAIQWGRDLKSGLTFTIHALLKRALADKDSGIRLVAVRKLQKMELENSIAWLIPRIFDENVDVQCAVTEVFEFFFNEEEAVTHRKRLAISPLIELLESDSPRAVVCAANALAAAESKRALLPLMQLLKQHQDTNVRVAVIRALGLIRDRSALVLLQRLVQNTDSEAPLVASSLIALSRLKAPTLDALYDRFFVASEQTDQARIYDTLNYLLSTPDSIVFSRNRLVSTLKEALDVEPIFHQPSQSAILPAQDQERALAALRAIAAAKIPQLEREVRAFLSAIEKPDEKILMQAMMTLALLDTASSRVEFETQLLKQQPVHVKTVLNRLIEKHYNFSRQLVLALYQRRDTSALVLDLLERLTVKKASVLFDYLLLKTSVQRDEQPLLALLTLCINADLNPLVDESLLSAQTPVLRLQAIDCYLQSRPDPGLRTDIKHNLLLQRLLRFVADESNIDEATRIRLLIKAAAHNTLIARTTLAKRLDYLPEKWLSSALMAIDTAGVIATIEDSLWALYNNTYYNIELRLQAARLLVSLDSRDERDRNVLATLFELFADNQNAP